MSAFASANGIRIMSGRISIPFYGAWTADLILATPDDLTGSVTLVLGDLTLVGAVYRTAPFAGARQARLVAGAGGWRQTIGAQSYQSPAGVMLSTVLGDAARSVRETLGPFLDRSLGADWERERGPASRLLRLVTDGTWWIDPAGVTQLGPRSTAPITSAFQVLDYHGGMGSYSVSTEVLADWTPGRSFTAATLNAQATISLVTLVVDNDGKLRVEVLSGAPEQDRLLANVLELVRSEFPKATYQGTYEYAVQAIAADGSTADLSPTDTTLTLPSIVKCPVRLSTATAKLSTGSLVLVAFVNGNPARPAIVGGSGVTELDLAGGADFVALASLVAADLATLKTAFNVHVHANLGVVPTIDISNKIPLWDGRGGTAPSVAASKVKAT